MKIIIGYLYGQIMNIYGDRGNILALVKRCQWRDINVQVINLEVGDKIDPKEIDLYFWGGGQDKEQNIASQDVLGNKGKSIVEGIENGAALLSVCGGYQLLGKYYRPSQGEELPGIGLFDTHTVAGNKRMIGNLVIELDKDFIQEGLRTAVGFENHSGKTYLGKNVRPFGRVVTGFGNNGEDRTEGCVYKNAIGCYLHGPLLPKNPHLADFLILKALQHRDNSVKELKPLDDMLELQAHISVLKRIKSSR